MIKGLWKTKQVFINDKELSRVKSQSIYEYYQDGFNWGYDGSGSAQLSLGLLLEFTDMETAKRLYQDFKADVISKLPKSDFETDNSVVEDWLDRDWLKDKKNK